MIEVGQKIMLLLESQVGHYQSMKQALEKQAAYIEAMDIGGLTAGASETRALMRKIRDLEADLRPLRQSWRDLDWDRPVNEKRKIDALVDEIRALIESIQKIKDENKTNLEQSMEQLRAQMTGLKTSTQATQAYHRRPATGSPARFIDQSK